MKIFIQFVFTIVCTALVSGTANSQELENVSTTFADNWEFVGVAVSEPGYHVWGTSPIIGDDGKVHLFCARWPRDSKFDPGWRTHSEIAHYVGETPEGPFVFSDVVIKGSAENISEKKSPAKTWDEFAPHNPAIHKVNDLYALFYIANDGLENHPTNQRIGLLLSKSLYGPWRKAGKDGMILAPPTDSSNYNFNAGNGVNNPAFIQVEDKFYLYFKSNDTRKSSDWKPKMGLAIAENIEGPYVQLKNPVTSNESVIEDGYAFMYNGKIALLTTDNHGMIEEGGGILWTSEDGFQFNNFEKGMNRISDYTKVDKQKTTFIFGTDKYVKPERPQVLMLKGKPKYLYVASGINIYGGDCTVSYVLKFKE